MKRIILHVFDINTGLEPVRKALSTLEGLRSWWTDDVTGSSETGGILKFRFGKIFGPDMKVIQNNESLVQWQCTGNEKAWAGDLFSFSCENTGKNIKMTFTQEYSNEITDEQYGRFNFNWGYYLNSFKMYCETGKGVPWKNK